MLRLTCALLASLALISCSGGDDDDSPSPTVVAPEPPPPLTASSPMTDVQTRYEQSELTFATIHGKVVGETPTGSFTEEVWFQPRTGARSELSGELTSLPGYKPGDVRFIRILETGEGEASLIQNVTQRYCRAPIATSPLPLRPIALPAELDLTKGRIEGEETVAGRPALKILRDTSVPGLFVWIDAVYGVILQQESNTTQVIVQDSTFTEIAYNEPLPENVFVPEFPSGYSEQPCDQLVAP